MDYKKKYLKYKKKYLESKNIIKNRITEEIKNNTNIKNKLKGGMSVDIINVIVAAVLSALGVGAGYLGYKHFIEGNEGELVESQVVQEPVVVQEGKSEEAVVEVVPENEPELTRTFTAKEETPLGVQPGLGGPRDKQKQEDLITMTQEEFDKKRGFEDPSNMEKEQRSALEESIRNEKKAKEIEEKTQKAVSGYY